ncbi:uncharacterized protein EV422DRAFT_619943 [Fimicolochytrium jonesii]|uniref:uncharacterized protein n=1 Tax=Fimicolochytrium jonesii TaxID=1396493 RepID=UPI0022FE6F0B|nr:uncharacterized protein EV422DRAFT_619943 [Fimicolochytrium jonesii]KAI8821038.1 hypothetical protein EV422DRAFT_619943 [Fimicolochytrium jonesii]
MKQETAIAANYALTSLALAIQTGNAIYGIKHAWQRKTLFNGVLAGCMVMYAASFIPLLFTARPAVLLADKPDGPGSPYTPFLTDLQNIVRVWTALYGLATFPYVILVQIRFRVVRSVIKYSKHWDTFFVIFTTLIWLSALAICGVIYPPSKKIAGYTTTIWTVYGLLCDNVFSMTFIFSIYNIRRKLNKNIEVLFRRVRTGLFFLCFMTWMGISFSVISFTLYSNNGVMRTLFFRISLLFSPLAYSGALVYLYTVRQLFQPQTRYSQQDLRAIKKSQQELRANAASSEKLTKPKSASVMLTATVTGTAPADSPIRGAADSFAPSRTESDPAESRLDPSRLLLEVQDLQTTIEYDDAEEERESSDESDLEGGNAPVPSLVKGEAGARSGASGKSLASQMRSEAPRMSMVEKTVGGENGDEREADGF